MEPHSRRRYGTLLLPQALASYLTTCSAEQTSQSVTQTHTDLSPLAAVTRIRISLREALFSLFSILFQTSWNPRTFVGMVKLTALCGIGSSLYLWRQRSHSAHKIPTSSHGSIKEEDVSDPAVAAALATDPALLKKRSTIRAYSVPGTGFTYPAIRTFYQPHAQEGKLPTKPRSIPLLVFIHGLGGSTAQFYPILNSLVTFAPCLAIDLPGCGISAFEPKSWKAYTTDALVQLLAVVIEAHRDRETDQAVVLVGHSMGCSLAALLASSTSPHAQLISEHVVGLVGICPKAEPPTEKERSRLKWITSIPGPIFDIMRKWDRRGGVNSKSVVRMTGPYAEKETKKDQLRFNQQSRTNVWRRMAWGAVPVYSNGTPRDGLPGEAVWKGLELPVLLVAGRDDSITPPDNLKKIRTFLGQVTHTPSAGHTEEKSGLPVAAAPIDPAIIDPAIAERKHQDSGVDTNDLPDLDRAATAASSAISTRESSSVVSSAAEPVPISGSASTADANASPANIPEPHPRQLKVSSTTLPPPAAHSLLFAPSTSRTVSGLIGDFLVKYVDPRLNLGWQLQYLVTEGKWDVKNLEKWRKIEPVSKPIAGIFRAMKTLREVDEQHSPKVFVKQWGPGRGDDGLKAVVDISHENPVYEPQGLEQGGIEYHKFPTVSKLPPTIDEVKDFIELIDKLRAEKLHDGKGLIGVHCHYGFNRTGFFLVSYMVERLGYKVEDAIDEFARRRRPGIRHAHFVDTLHVRYHVGLKRAPTL